MARTHDKSNFRRLGDSTVNTFFIRRMNGTYECHIRRMKKFIVDSISSSYDRLAIPLITFQRNFE